MCELKISFLLTRLLCLLQEDSVSPPTASIIAHDRKNTSAAVSTPIQYLHSVNSVNASLEDEKFIQVTDSLLGVSVDIKIQKHTTFSDLKTKVQKAQVLVESVLRYSHLLSSKRIRKLRCRGISDIFRARARSSCRGMQAFVSYQSSTSGSCSAGKFTILAIFLPLRAENFPLRLDFILFQGKLSEVSEPGCVLS